jgi:hypothetical protein
MTTIAQVRACRFSALDSIYLIPDAASLHLCLPITQSKRKPKGEWLVASNRCDLWIGSNPTATRNKEAALRRN